MLRDRETVGGGWNYGNRVVLGEDLEPYAQTTAAALVALQRADPALEAARSLGAPPAVARGARRRADGGAGHGRAPPPRGRRRRVRPNERCSTCSSARGSWTTSSRSRGRRSRPVPALTRLEVRADGHDGPAHVPGAIRDRRGRRREPRPSSAAGSFGIRRSGRGTRRRSLRRGRRASPCSARRATTPAWTASSARGSARSAPTSGARASCSSPTWSSSTRTPRSTPTRGSWRPRSSRSAGWAPPTSWSARGPGTAATRSSSSPARGCSRRWTPWTHGSST